MDKKQVSKMIDHTILKTVAKKDEIIKLCDEAKHYDFASVCVNPCHVSLAKEKLKGSDVKVCTVIGFPLGANDTNVKAFEAKNAVEQGALEVDMVINIGALKDGDLDLVKKDIKAVVDITKKTNKNAIVKVIIETCLLSEEEKVDVLKLLPKTGADFVKTSTGFSTGGATVSDIALMKKHVGDSMSIKASGGVKSYSDLIKMKDAGANRIGTSSGIAILTEEE